MNFIDKIGYYKDDVLFFLETYGFESNIECEYCSVSEGVIGWQRTLTSNNGMYKHIVTVQTDDNSVEICFHTINNIESEDQQQDKFIRINIDNKDLKSEDVYYYLEYAVLQEINKFLPDNLD